MAGVNGATSPSGDRHPGEILHEDRIDARRWIAKAVDVPQSVAWVDVAGAWLPVVRIEITGTAERRRITKFGKDGQYLESTVYVLPPSTSCLDEE